MPTWIIQLLFSLGSSVPGLISMAEQAFSGKPGSGEQKKELVLQSTDMLVKSFAMVPGADKTALNRPEVHEEIMLLASNLTDSVVRIVKLIGAFRGEDAVR